MVRTRLRNAAWTRLRGSAVFALPSHPGTWERQCMAAVLSVPGGALSGPAGAALHGFPGWPRAGIEVVVRYGTTTRSPFAVVRRSHTVGRCTIVRGIRVVSPADCLIQLAGRLDARALGELVDHVAQTRRTIVDELRDRHVEIARSRLPGIESLRRVLEVRGDEFVPPAGALERRLADVLALVPGLPPVLWEATPPWLEAGRGRVDALIPAWRLVVEADGRSWHTRVEDFERDRWRDNVALAHGYATLRFSWLRLTTDATACRNLLVAVGADRVCSAAAPATA